MTTLKPTKRKRLGYLSFTKPKGKVGSERSWRPLLQIWRTTKPVDSSRLTSLMPGEGWIYMDHAFRRRREAGQAIHEKRGLHPKIP